ncbi:MAG: LLM class flavin-dependent oxidoreductase [Devosia sp.]
MPWPDKPERNARLLESVEIIRALLAGETVTHRGRVSVVEAKLYTRPLSPLPVYGAAVSSETARWVGRWADGLLTVAGDDFDAVRKVVDAFREGGGDGKPVILQAALSWAATEEAAMSMALEQWRHAAIGGEVAWDLRRPADFDQASKSVGEDEIRQSLAVSADWRRHLDWIAALFDLEPAEIHLHQIGRNQRDFIETFGAHVLPELRRLNSGPR